MKYVMIVFSLMTLMFPSTVLAGDYSEQRQAQEDSMKNTMGDKAIQDYYNKNPPQAGQPEAKEAPPKFDGAT